VSITIDKTQENYSFANHELFQVHFITSRQYWDL